MLHSTDIKPSRALKSVRYEIRRRLARRAVELERQGYEILSLNIGNPGIFGFRTPDTGYRDHFRITTLADEDAMGRVFRRIDDVPQQMANRPPILESA